MRVTALVTSHNRRRATVACLEAYFDQSARSRVTLDAVLVDDGSVDQTADEVQRRFADVEVVRGNGDLYWARGMATAERVAEGSDPDYVLWLNDDVQLDPGALEMLLSVEECHEGIAIAVGATRGNDAQITYSGLRRRDWHPLRFDRVEPNGLPQIVDTFNGNVVLVSRAVRRLVGPIDGGFAHAQADFDFGLRARRLGVVSLLVDRAVGSCELNGDTSWLDQSRSRCERLATLLGPKGIPPASTARFLRRHGSWTWPLLLLASYARALVSIIKPVRHASVG